VYKSPCVKIKTFLNQFENFLDFHKSKRSFIIGDFNIDLLKHSNKNDINNFIDLMLTNSFCPLINRPTRITNFSSSLIDNIWTNVVSNNSVSYLIYSDISDHLPILCLLNNAKPPQQAKHAPQKVYRDFNRKNLNNINAELASHDWNNIMCQTNADKAYDIFHEYIQMLINKHCPHRTVKNKRNNKIQLTNTLKKCLSQKRPVV
jgi:predicted transcriptional regulator